jgi:prepilin-type N-terminal cleavage/methylation domain-containing protein
MFSGRLQSEAGFSLLEMMLASSLGLVLAAAAFNALFGDSSIQQRLVRSLRERQVMQRATALIRSDVERGVALALNPAQASAAACGLSGRKPVLQITSSDGKLTTYSVGAPSDRIWRGWVLMRCGRAFRLDGSLNPTAAFQNRVVLDGLDPSPSRWGGCELPHGELLSGTDQLPLAVCHEQLSGAVQWSMRQRFNDQLLQLGGNGLLGG